MEAMEKEKNLPLPGTEKPVVHPVAQSITEI
jgi:hypothetical protein